MSHVPAPAPSAPGGRGTSDGWPPGPRAPRLAPGELHVWLADLTDVPDAVTESLSAQERARAERILSPRKGELWARSRGLLRQLLAGYLGIEPGTLQFRTSARGKPWLAVSNEAANISFNLSHSGPLALYAFNPSGSVGVDVELNRHGFDESPAAARAFDSTDASRWTQLSPKDRRREFLARWVRYEAEAKCLGGGLAGSRAAVKRRAGGTRCVACNRGGNQRPLWLRELDLGDDAAGAAAADTLPEQLRCWQWRSSTPSRADRCAIG
jgi:4'-phosphopantetheinyl transferase